MTEEQFELLYALVQTLQERQDELTLVVGTMEGFLLFFVVALVCWLVYKFFRIFF